MGLPIGAPIGTFHVRAVLSLDVVTTRARPVELDGRAEPSVGLVDEAEFPVVDANSADPFLLRNKRSHSPSTPDAPKFPLMVEGSDGDMPGNPVASELSEAMALRIRAIALSSAEVSMVGARLPTALIAAPSWARDSRCRLVGLLGRVAQR